MAPDDTDLDATAVAAWLAADVDPSITTVELTPVGVGHSNGATFVRAHTDSGPLELVFKAPRPGIVHLLDGTREADILAAAHAAGAPVPAVVAIDRVGTVAGRPGFALVRVPGRSVDDDALAGYHGEGWFRELDDGERAGVWFSVHDTLARIHATDAAALGRASHGPGGLADVIDYWRDAVVEPGVPVPRQLAALDWLADHLPADGDESPALCLGDARLVNGIIDGEVVRAVVDLEVAYLGDPRADIAYSYAFDRFNRRAATSPLRLPPEDEVWARWSDITGRPTHDRGYWTAFAITVLCITATRAMTRWYDAADFTEDANPVIASWEAAIADAERG